MGTEGGERRTENGGRRTEQNDAEQQQERKIGGKWKVERSRVEYNI